tara:strand:+ start:3105 stop:3737 length:633 start_codon:yes stop_codon:yes gene_type:complete
LPSFHEKLAFYSNNTNHVGQIVNADSHSLQMSKETSDVIAFYLKMKPGSKTIQKISFVCFGDSTAFGMAEWLSNDVEGMSIAQANEHLDDFKLEFDKEISEKLKASAESSYFAIRAVIENYMHKNKMRPFDLPTNDSLIESFLERIYTGDTNNLVDSNLVDYIGMREHTAIIKLSISRAFPLAEIIEKLIRTNLSHRWDLEKVDIEFALS